jgi:hypothetical protein
VGGFVFAFFFIWAVAAVFADSVTVYAWDSLLETFVRGPGSVIRQRGEGWADTPIGRHGLP